MVFRSSCSSALHCLFWGPSLPICCLMFVVPCFHRTAGHSTVLVTMIMTCLGHIVYWRANESFLMVFRSSCSYAQCTVMFWGPSLPICCPLFSQDSRSFHSTSDYDHDTTYSLIRCLLSLVFTRQQVIPQCSGRLVLMHSALSVLRSFTSYLLSLVFTGQQVIPQY